RRRWEEQCDDACGHESRVHGYPFNSSVRSPTSRPARDEVQLSGLASRKESVETLVSGRGEARHFGGTPFGRRPQPAEADLRRLRPTWSLWFIAAVGQ